MGCTMIGAWRAALPAGSRVLVLYHRDTPLPFVVFIYSNGFSVWGVMK